MSQKILKWIDILLPVALVCLLILVLSNAAHAQGALGEGWDQFLKGTGLKTFAGTDTGTAGETVAMAVVRRAISLVKYLVAGVALVFGMLYASALVFARGSEETITKQKKNFLWAFLGFIILMAADGFSSIFNPVSDATTAEHLIDFGAARDQLRNVVDYVKWMLGSIIVMLMTISGIRLVVASGNEEVTKKQKMNLVWSGIGMLVILLASNIVNAIYVVNASGEVAPAAPTTTAEVIGGIIRLILIFLGPAAVLFTLYAGFYYLTALESEERSKKARAMIVAGVTGIVIIYSAYALVNTFYGAPALTNLSQPTP